ncbi:hypothetical protein ABW19_dt0206443 [Dactylella cylindrospora]|nr:hypothetical protein ABW19_dt0206443 [Dactylella cylindrospora]
MHNPFKRSPTLQIYITSHSRGLDALGNPKPEHWAIVITKSLSTPGTAHHVIHGHPLFEYRPRENVYVLKSQSLTHVLHIGKIYEKDIGRAEDVFENVGVDNVDAEWNCQNWVAEAVVGLEGLGVVEKGKAGRLRVLVNEASDGRDLS